MRRARIRVTLVGLAGALAALYLFGATAALVLGPVPVLAAIGAALVAAAARWQHRRTRAAAAQRAAWARFLSGFEPGARPAVSVLCDPYAAGQAWGRAGLPAPILRPAPGDHGVFPSGLGARMRVQMRPGQHLDQYTDAAPVLAAALGVGRVTVRRTRGRVLDIELVTHRAILAAWQ